MFVILIIFVKLSKRNTLKKGNIANYLYPPKKNHKNLIILINFCSINIYININYRPKLKKKNQQINLYKYLYYHAFQIYLY